MYAAFKNRPNKIIDGVSYPGGSIPSGTETSADKIILDGFTTFKKVSAAEVYALTIKATLDGTKVFSAIDNKETNKNYTLEINYNLRVFNDEEEMKNSSDYQESVENGTFAGLILFGKKTYGDKGTGGEVPILMPNNAAAHAFGDDGRNPKHIVLVDLGVFNDQSAYVHEIGHNLGVGHITQGDVVVPMSDNKEYNTIGMMKGVPGAPEAPFKSQLIRIINTLNSLIENGQSK